MELLEILTIQNSWWKTGQVRQENLGSFYRELFSHILAKLNKKEILSIIGPRRSGKTILIHQLIQHLLDQKTAPQRIVYLSLDNLSILKPSLIDQIVQSMAELLNEPVDEFKKPVFIFLDEVHKLAKWANQVKHWQDLNLNIKFIISGSSAMQVIKGAGESLLGRIDHHTLFPLSFKEFLNVKHQIKMQNIDIFDFRQLKKQYAQFLPYQAKIQLALKDYLKRGGYPALLNEKIEEVFKILLEYKDLSLQRDIFDLEEIRDTKTLNELVLVLASLATERLSYNKLGTILLARVNTIKRYLGLLEDIYLIKEAVVYKKPYTALKYEKKVYLVDPGMINALTMNYELKEEAKLIENIVAMHIYRLNLKQEINPRQYYWLNDGEVDVIGKNKDKVIPIEVKYRENPEILKSIKEFMHKFNAPQGIIVSKNMFQQKKDIFIVPAWLFLASV